MSVNGVQEVVVRSCTAADVATITATEHPDARIAERLFARPRVEERLSI